MKNLIAVLLAVISMGANAACNCAGDDTAFVQNAVVTGAELPHGVCMVSSTIILNGNESLVGQGVRGTDDCNPAIRGTMLKPIAPIAGPMVQVTNGTTRIEDVEIGYDTTAHIAQYGILVGGMPFDIDRVYIRNVMVMGGFDVSFFCRGGVSSRMDFAQIWNKQPGAYVTQWDDCSTWTVTGHEFHMHSDQNNDATPILTYNESKLLFFFGGLVSRKVGNPGDFYRGGGYSFHDTFFYYE